MSRSGELRKLTLEAKGPRPANAANPNSTVADDGVNRVTLTDQVHEILKRQIVQRHLVPGAKLDVGDLATRLGTSRMPIVDALNRLEMEGLVERRDRVGTFVTPFSPVDFDDLYAARLMVEQWAMEPIVASIKDTDIEQLKMLLRDSKSLLKDVSDETFDYRRFLELDQDFHVNLMGLCKNLRILDWYRSLNAHIQVGRVYSLRALKRCKGAQAEHEKILAALEARDAERARDAVKEHLSVSQNGILGILNARGDL
ncbi:MAG: GntR family transcriptional regulator [Deltaproteobacteria bacterium]|nr:GntR family transcriptional regulator [Deltaproteobacteria bacterium]